jgi:hypothetical protein
MYEGVAERPWLLASICAGDQPADCKALCLEIAPTLLARADKLIEANPRALFAAVHEAGKWHF